MHNVFVAITLVLAFGLGAIFIDVAVERKSGHSWSSLAYMKNECEAELPRNQECVASILFLPTASEE